MIGSRRSIGPRWLVLLALGASCAAGGCGQRETLGQVHGRVSFQGTPLKAGVVGFDNVALGVHMTAQVDEQGAYRVSMAKGYGLPLGDYRVAVYPYVADLPVGSTQRPQPREFPDIPPRYRKPETSGLTLSVKAGDNPFDIDLRP